MLKYLRIAVTALSLTACVLLIALWVRSYRTIDRWSKVLSKNQSLTFGSAIGNLSINWYYDAEAAWKWPDHSAWQWRTEPASDWHKRINNARLAFGGRAVKSWQPPIYFRNIDNNRTYAFARHWVLALITGILAALPWNTPAVQFQPPHTANRHDAGCGGAGDNCHGAVGWGRCSSTCALL